MGNEFERIVTQYTNPHCNYSSGYVGPSNSVVYFHSGHTMELLGFAVTYLSGDATYGLVDFTNMMLRLTIDGTILFDDRIYVWAGALPMYNFSHEQSRCDVQNGYWPRWDFRLKIPCNNGFEFRFYTDQPRAVQIDFTTWNDLGS